MFTVKTQLLWQKSGKKCLKIKHWKLIFWRCISSDHCPHTALKFLLYNTPSSVTRTLLCLLYAFPIAHCVFNRSMLTSCMNTSLNFSGTWKSVSCTWLCLKSFSSVPALEYSEERNGERWKLQSIEVYSIGDSIGIPQSAAQIFLKPKIDTHYPLPLCSLLLGHETIFKLLSARLFSSTCSQPLQNKYIFHKT